MVKKLIMAAFVALAVGMAIPSTRAQIADSTTPIKDEIGRRLVPRRIQTMADQLDVRLGRGEGLPERFDAWLRRDYSGVPDRSTLAETRSRQYDPNERWACVQFTGRLR